MRSFLGIILTIFLLAFPYLYRVADVDEWMLLMLFAYFSGVGVLLSDFWIVKNLYKRSMNLTNRSQKLLSQLSETTEMLFAECRRLSDENKKLQDKLEARIFFEMEG